MSTLTIARPDATSTDRRRPAAASLLRDTGIVMTRELRPVLRDPFSLIFGMIQPLVFLGAVRPAAGRLARRQAGERSAAACGSGSCRRSW